MSIEDVLARTGPSTKVDAFASLFSTPRTVGELRAVVELLELMDVPDDRRLDDSMIYVRLDVTGRGSFTYCGAHLVSEGDKFSIIADAHVCGDDDV